MKIVSISTADRKWLLSNYGGFLQHFALREVLKKSGFLPYRVEAERMRSEIKALVKAVLRPFKDIANNILSFVDRRRKWRPVKMFWYWWHKVRFIQDYRKLIGCLFEDSHKECFASIVGGGQAWSIYCQDRPDLYWECDPRQMKRIAYSVSSAWIALANNEGWKKRLAAALHRADSVSLREKAGADLCASLVAGKEYAVCLDPVFLLSAEEYEEYIPMGKSFRHKTLFCYFVEVYDKEYIDVRKFKALADRLGCECRMVGIQGAEHFIPRHLLENPGPVDFLRHCRDAEFIITNSFHGVVLAIVFGKKFLFLGQRDPQNTGNRNQRQMELLAEFGLMNRSVPVDADVIDMMTAMQSKIDWQAVSATVREKRKFSIDWLCNALS